MGQASLFAPNPVRLALEAERKVEMVATDAKVGKRVYAHVDLKQASAGVVRKQAILREQALKHGQRRGEWRGWGFGGKLAKKGCNERRKAV